MGGLRFGGGLLHEHTASESNNNNVSYIPMAIPSHLTPSHWTSSTKLISPDKAYCSISLENINEGDEYCECVKCNNCFLAESLKTSFTHLAKKCPLCRETWTNWIVYENSENGTSV
jgi:phage FluMu protein Com